MYHSETAETDADEVDQEVTGTDKAWLSAGEAVIMPPRILVIGVIRKAISLSMWNTGTRSDPHSRITPYLEQWDEERSSQQ